VTSDATWLIAGGLGGLGLLAARWLAEEGVKGLALVTRRGITTPEQRDAVEALRAAGAEVRVFAADIADRAAVEGLLAQIAEGMPPLRGVLHAAGALADGLLVNQDVDRFRAVYAPKVLGAWNLHALTRDLPLDHFVLYSSAAGLLGAPGMGNYAAANAFLDALAHHRRRLGLPALSIDWGLFAEVGMGLKAEGQGRATERGLRSFGAEEGQRLFRHLLRVESAQIGVVGLDARRWLEASPLAARFQRLSALVAEGRAARAASPRAQGLGDALRQALPSEHALLLERFALEQAARVLRMDPKRLDADRPLQEVGIDSVMGLQLRTVLEGELGVSLPATLVWTYPTVQQIAAHLVRLWREREEHAAPNGNGGAHPKTPSDVFANTAAKKPPAEDDDLLASFDAEIDRIDDLVKG
jgi:acyl carrier protein